MIEAICAFDLYFVQKIDAIGTLGLSSIQKCIVAIHMIGYGVPFNATYEYTRVTKNTNTKCMKRFVRAIHGVYKEQYIEQLTREKLEK